MSRSTPEWIGATDDTAIPPRVRLRVFDRASGRCEECTRKLMPGDAWDCDHVIALALGGENREGNLRILCKACHREKTRADVATKSKIARIRAKHTGAKVKRRNGLTKPPGVKYDWSAGRYVKENQ